MIEITHLTKSYLWSKKSLEWIVEDGALGNLAPPGHREESASRQICSITIISGACSMHALSSTRSVICTINIPLFFPVICVLSSAPSEHS